MAAGTQTITYYRRSGRSPKSFLVVLFVLVLVTLAMPQMVQTYHAGLHDEASMIRQCATDPANIRQVWINSSGERLNCLINLPDGRLGDYVVQWCKKSGWIEVTAYVIGDGSLAEAIRVLRAKACTLVYPR